MISRSATERPIALLVRYGSPRLFAAQADAERVGQPVLMLATFGAVSKRTATTMAVWTKTANVDLALSIAGIAGPKPEPFRSAMCTRPG